MRQPWLQRLIPILRCWGRSYILTAPLTQSLWSLITHLFSPSMSPVSNTSTVAYWGICSANHSFKTTAWLYFSFFAPYSRVTLWSCNFCTHKSLNSCDAEFSDNSCLYLCLNSSYLSGVWENHLLQLEFHRFACISIHSLCIVSFLRWIHSLVVKDKCTNKSS